MHTSGLRVWVHLENNAKWCIYGVVTHAHVIYYYLLFAALIFASSVIVYWNIDLCLFAFGALTSVESRSSFFWRIRDTVDSLTLTFYLFSIQLTYSIRVPGVWWAYRQNSYFWASVKVIFVFGGMTINLFILCSYTIICN